MSYSDQERISDWITGCFPKKKHSTEAVALKQIERDIKVGYYKRGAKEPYKCKNCPFWHVGRSRKKKEDKQ